MLSTVPPPSRARQPVFRPTTQDHPVVCPTSQTRRKILVHVVTKITGDFRVAEAILDVAVREFGADDVPDDDEVYEVFVRSYLVPRVMPYGSVAGVQQMIHRLLS